MASSVPASSSSPSRAKKGLMIVWYHSNPILKERTERIKNGEFSILQLIWTHVADQVPGYG